MRITFYQGQRSLQKAVPTEWPRADNFSFVCGVFPDMMRIVLVEVSIPAEVYMTPFPRIISSGIDQRMAPSLVFDLAMSASVLRLKAEHHQKRIFSRHLSST